MSQAPTEMRGEREVLDPIDRLSEIGFGLLMALTFTGTMSVTLGEGGEVRDVLLAALGCNLAWGIVDAMVYVLTSYTDRGRRRATGDAIRSASPAQAREMLREALPDGVGNVLSAEEIDQMAAMMRAHPRQAPQRELTGDDLRAALAVFVLVTLATLPPTLPFLLFDDLPLAMRISNGVALFMLALIGWRLDRLMGDIRHLVWIVPILGSILVVVTIALGG
ncbi:VIT1/CCC1 transporter family protein [Tabrizicola sp. J26]|uniref:VIT1/CCC1 transporter family protein n=1 Tax=Alitabrizicola rongguiensis TaxID=2909234 RepID=UPI001F2A2B26|nr:VIT1/CCC1 transporter family protein [Tabrizicola rongguiensis]MCF1709472.1 VIT1/CCC1 transporter family protein [Tabrizicola rongguiensis]